MASSLSDILSTIQNGVIALNNFAGQLKTTLNSIVTNLTAIASAAGNFIQAGTGAVTRTMQNKARDFVNVMDFGAVCDGVTDDTAAIQLALNTGKTVVLPSAVTCLITGTLTITVSGTGLVGAGWQSSVLTSSAAAVSTPMIMINAAVNNVYLADFKLTRSVAAAVNSNGITFNGNTEGTLVENLWIEKQYNGFQFRTTAFGVLQNLISALNLNNGYFFADTATAGVLQWELRGALASQNGNVGFLVQTGNGALQSTMGTWTSIYTFANSSYGVAFIGTAAAPIYDVRLMDMFLGTDGHSELFLDTYGGSILIGDCFFELAGKGLTGPTGATPATGIGSGIQATANNRDLRISNCISDGNSEAGYTLAATQENNLSGSRASNNGTYGLVLADGTTGIVTGFKFQGNTSGTYSIAANDSSIVGAGNNSTIKPNVESSLGADVALNNVANYFDGPSIVMGAGTWLVTGQISVTDTAVASIFAKLWDGTNIIASGTSSIPAANRTALLSLSGVITCTNGTIVKISARDTTTVNGVILFNNTGNSKDSTITASKIG